MSFQTVLFLVQVLSSFVYSNENREPLSQLARIITISLDNNTDFINCSISLNVINTPDKPVIPVNHTADYIEDSGLVRVTDTNISITDEDNYFLYVAIIWLNNTVPGANDSIYIPESFNANFTVSGNGSTRINVTARSMILGHPEFNDLLQNILFQTDDQSTNTTRELYFTVEEIPLGEAGPSEPALVYINMIPVNDRPILTSSPFVTNEVLNDYFETNTGFLPSYLINSSIVTDIDSTFPLADDIIGVAIYSTVSDGLGEWQYWMGGTWVGIGSVMMCSPRFISDNQRIRFLPSPNATKSNGVASFEYRVWDGKSQEVCVGETLREDDGECNLITA